jgi:peptidoglycan hydrolase-like amidase
MLNNPTVSVGILTDRSIRFALRSAYTCGAETVGRTTAEPETATATALGISWRGQIHRELTFTPKEAEDASFSLYDVTIGKAFHWQQQELQTFKGTLRIVSQGGRLYAINILPVETYLESVISSEMSPTSSLEFLKAHAVISRSWLMAQIARRKQQDRPSPRLQPESSIATGRRPGLVVKWYNHEDHRLFDVCADDHCQRYQGTGRVRSPQAAEAVRQTRGQVLTYGGNICDARFSKCCGGRLEVFSSCWEDTDMPYLASKPDIIQGDLRAAGVDTAFCNTSDPAILSQVLNNFDQPTTDFYRWRVSYTVQELSRIVREKSGIDFGDIISLRPVRRGPSGRIVLLEIAGQKQTVTVGKELEIRKWLSPTHLYSSASMWSRLPKASCSTARDGATA